MFLTDLLSVDLNKGNRFHRTSSGSVLQRDDLLFLFGFWAVSTFEEDYFVTVLESEMRQFNSNKRVWGETSVQFQAAVDGFHRFRSWDGSTAGHNQDVLTETFNWGCEGTAAGNCESHQQHQQPPSDCVC